MCHSMVYTVKSDSVKDLLGASAADMQVKTILPMPYDMLASAEFVTAKGTYVLQKQAAAESAESVADGASEDAGEPEEDEAEKARKALWAQVSALKASGNAGEKAGDQILSVHAVNTEGKECTVVFLEYDTESYQAIVDGGQPRTVPAEEIDAIVRTVKSLL